MRKLAKSKNGKYLDVEDPEFEEGALECGCVGRCTCDDGRGEE